MSKSLNQLRDEAYATAKAKGWYDKPATFGDRVALCHSELSEALEDFRNGEPLGYVWYEDPSGMRVIRPTEPAVDGVCDEWRNKPCGIPSELADAIIRILDLCGANGIDIEKAVEEKMSYNSARPYRHGNKAL